MYQVLAIGLGILILIAAFLLMLMAHAMRVDKIPPNSWLGIRTKTAHSSESAWYLVQRAGATPLIGLAIAYANSSILFILQGIYYQTISELIPISVFTLQSVIGIVWIYRSSKKSDFSQ